MVFTQHRIYQRIQFESVFFFIFSICVLDLSIDFVHTGDIIFKNSLKVETLIRLLLEKKLFDYSFHYGNVAQ